MKGRKKNLYSFISYGEESIKNVGRELEGNSIQNTKFSLVK